MKIYVNGCTTCGINKLLIQRVIREASEHVLVINTRKEPLLLPEHLQHVKNAGMAGTPAIVVGDGYIKLLEEWK